MFSVCSAFCLGFYFTALIDWWCWTWAGICDLDCSSCRWSRLQVLQLLIVISSRKHYTFGWLMMQFLYTDVKNDYFVYKLLWITEVNYAAILITIIIFTKYKLTRLTSDFKSSSVRAKSNTFEFSIILSALVDFGIVIKPFCRLQRISTWATDLFILAKKVKIKTSRQRSVSNFCSLTVVDLHIFWHLSSPQIYFLLLVSVNFKTDFRLKPAFEHM